MKKIIKSVNLHLSKRCNAHCKFCFARFAGTDKEISVADWIRILCALKKAGTEKVTFVGGEPSLYVGLEDLIRKAKELEMVTSVVSNGFNMERVLQRAGDALDWLGLSLDSLNDATLKKIGRLYQKNQAFHIAGLFELASRKGTRIKMNTTVCSLNKRECLADFVRTCGVERWKVFQVTEVKGENDRDFASMSVSRDEFQRFADANYVQGISVFESAEQMIDSYAMISPEGAFFGNTGNRFHRGLPILDVGVEASLNQVGYELERLENRGGIYNWQNKGGHNV